MKKRLNILCLLVILVMGYSVSDSAYQVVTLMVSSFEKGFQAGKKGTDVHNELAEVKNMQPVAVFPDNFPFFNDSVLNEKSGEYVPMMHLQMLVSIETNPGIWQQLAGKSMAIVNLLAILLSIFIFIKLIISINRSVIFDWKNVRRLRWLGCALILSFVCEVIPVSVIAHSLSDVFVLRGYSLHFSELITITNLVLGLSALIVGEVFAIGLRMKEEQELTI